MPVPPTPQIAPHPAVPARPPVAPHPVIPVHPAPPAAAPPHPGSVAVPPPPPRPPVNVPVTINKPPNLVTVNPGIIHLQNPQFRPPPPPPVPRTAFDLPTVIAGNANVSDNSIFQAPKDPSRRFYLPHYGVAPSPGADGHTPWVEFQPSGSGYQLIVHLNDVTPPPLSQGNGPLQQGVGTRYLIAASLQGRAVSWDLTPTASPAGAILTLTLAIPDFGNRDMLYTAMTDPSAQARLIVRRSFSVAWPAAVAGSTQVSYVHNTLGVDSAIPFTFSKDLDAAIFANLTGQSSAAPTWRTEAVDWNGRRYPYYQASNQLSQVYFLPDSFRVGRETDPPHRPTLAVSSSGADQDHIAMTLSYTAAPEWDQNRIDDAATALQKTLGLTAPPAMGLFQATQTSLFLNLPSADPAVGNALAEQKGAVIDLTAGIQGSVTMGLTQFKQVYDAMFDKLSAILSGEVHVTVAADNATIPFIARIDDVPADLLNIETTIDVATNTLQVTLRNTIESPMHVEALTGTIMRAGQAMDSSVTGTVPPLPADIGPAAASPDQTDGTLVVTLAPSTASTVSQAIGGLIGGLLGGGRDVGGQALNNVSAQLLDNTCVPNLDMSKIAMSPDRTTFFKAIMRDQSIGVVSRPVALKFLAAQLTPTQPPPNPAPAPADVVAAVQVVFDGGKTADFDASLKPDDAGFLNQTVTMDVPMDAFILGTASSNNYKYRTDIVTGAGIKQGDWTTDNADTLYVVLPS